VVLVESFVRLVGVACAVGLLTSCGSSGSSATDPAGPSGPATVTVTSSPTPSDSQSTGPNDVDDDSAIPPELVGTWQSVDQGTAEDLIEMHADGSYLRATILMQQRPSGMFSFSIGAKGDIEIDGTTLRLVPTSGTESLTDPDAPSDSYTDRPLADLTPDVYEWSMSGGSLWLDGQYGVVEFRPSAP
jgi:hypothetical protein